MVMNSLLRRYIALILVMLGAAVPVKAAPLEAWLTDMEQMQLGFAQNYANFSYAVASGKMNLPALSAKTATALRAAPDDAGRRAALQAMARAFRDPHVSARLLEKTGSMAFDPACSADEAALAKAAGVKFTSRQNFVPLGGPAAKSFSAGILTAASGKKYGVLRVATFVNRGWGDVCVRAAAKMGFAAIDPCNDVCGDRLDAAIVRQLNLQLAEAVSALQNAGASALVIDVSGNAGGGDWAEVAARIVGGPLPGARLAMLRHPVWITEMDARLKDIDAGLVRARGPWRARLMRAKTAGMATLGDLQQTCDASVAWQDAAYSTGKKKLPCAMLVQGKIFTTGFEETRLPARAPSLEAEAAVYSLVQYEPFATGTTRLPLLVLVDGETYSAAEQLAARLQDYAGAKVLGTPTPGAGCGHAAGGANDFILPTSQLVVTVPDCARLRRDGSNERRGIRPDVILPFKPKDSAQQRADKAAAALR
jgi:Peptidase family S41